MQAEHGPVDSWLTAAFDPIGLDQLNAKAAMLERLDNKYIHLTNDAV